MSRSPVVCAALYALLSLPLTAASWRPIPPGEFAAGRSELDPSSGAVVLLREITIDNGDFDGAMQAYYVRTKVFDQKGIDAVLQTQIPYEKGQRPRAIAARVVKPDGTAVELDPKSIYTREVVRIGREAMLAKSFSLPALEPGCIVELQYKIHSDEILLGMHLPMSDDFPVAVARIRMKNFTIPGRVVQSLWSDQLNMERLPQTDHGFRIFEGHDVAPVANEPLSPPDSLIKPWFSYYFTLADGSATNFWSYEAGNLAAAAKDLLASRKPLKDKATELTAGLPDDAARLHRLYDFCRTEIKNLSSDASGYTPEEIEALEPNRTPVNTLANGYGTDTDINVLFGALVNALGGKCTLAYCGDRSRFIFHRDLKLRAALPHLIVGVLRGAEYEFYDPGAMYLPAGRLRWMNDTTTAIVIEGKLWRMIEIPATAPEYSTTKRIARLKLDATGTLEGEVTIELTGHDGIAAKHEFDAKTEDERRETILATLAERLGHAEISDLLMQNVTDPDHPIQISYRVKAEGYAELTADRIFVQPAFFQKGLPALFTASVRKNDIYFPYQYTTSDHVTIELPSGFTPEQPRSPAPLNVNKLLLYQPEMQYSRRTGRLILKREFSFYGERLPAPVYPQVKTAFERVAAQDAHKLALMRTPSPDATPSAAEPAATSTTP